MSKQMMHNPDDPNNIWRIRNMTKKEIKMLQKRISSDKTISMEEMRERIHLYISENKMPFRIKLKIWLKKIRRKFSCLWWRIRNILWDKHNIIKIKTLPSSYSDHDTKILHACFSIFCDLIEKSEFFKHTSFDYSEEIEQFKNHKWENEAEKESTIKLWEESQKKAKHVQSEIQYLYDWWTKTRPQRDELKYYDLDAHNIALEYYKEDNDHLIRLIKMREYLWD